MTDITIKGRVAERLEQMARETNREIEEIVEEALDLMVNAEGTRPQVETTDDFPEPPQGTLAHMAWSASQNPILGGSTDTAERSREILRNEYADHLLKRLNDPDEDVDE
jgi:hypothetical protein